MTVSNSTTILRTKTFLWLNSNGVLSQLSSITNGFILGSANSVQGEIGSALLLPVPAWNSSALNDPWVLDEDFIKNLTTEFNVSDSLNIAGSALSVDALANTGILALVVSSESLSPQSLLLGLSELDGTPEIRWSSLLPNEQISGLLNFKIGTSERLHTFGSSLEGDGVIRDYPGYYTQYRILEKSNQSLASLSSDITSTKEFDTKKVAPENGTPTTTVVNKKATEKMTFKEKHELDTLNKTMPELERKKQVLTNQLNEPNLDYNEIIKLSEQLGALNNELETAELRWLELSEKQQA